MNEKEIKLHELIIEGNEKEAIELLKSDDTINVNFVYKERTLIFSALNEKMYTLFETIINYPKFDSHTEDGFGETIFQSLIWLYNADENKEIEAYCERKKISDLIKIILKTNTYDFNYQDLNLDTALHVACGYLEDGWITEALITKEYTNINAINDMDETPLTVAIKRNNIEAIKLLSKRKDLIVRDVDVKEAEKNNIDLAEYGINVKELKDTKAVNVSLREKVLVESK